MFDSATAIPIKQGSEETPERMGSFDIASAKPTEFTGGKQTAYEEFVGSQLEKQARKGEIQPRIMKPEYDPGILRSAAAAYTKGTIGFFTRPFGKEPDLSKKYRRTIS